MSNRFEADCCAEQIGGRVSAKWGAILAWSLGFILAETLGVIVGFEAASGGLGAISASGLADLTTVASRSIVLAILPAITGLKLRNAIYSPRLKRKQLHVILLGTIIIFISSYLENSFSIPLMGINYFLDNGAPWAFVAQILYYLSEIIIVNYMYILARAGWKWRRGPITAGTLFVILGWASLHAITKNAAVAAFAVVLVLILYTSYEYTKSPLSPIILWLVELIG